jgi:hypothetical protein
MNSTAPTISNAISSEKNKLEKFLSRRDAIVTTIEISTTLFQKIGSSHPIELSHLGIDNHQSGCIVQFFNFYQKILTDCIYMNFITVLGNYNKKNDSLKSWANVNFSNDLEKIQVLSDLKNIRQRYADARNDLICHINDGVETHAGVPTAQIIDDIVKLRDVINTIRIANNIPRVISMTSRDNQYPVKGFQAILGIFKGSNESNTHN